MIVPSVSRQGQRVEANDRFRRHLHVPRATRMNTSKEGSIMRTPEKDRSNLRYTGMFLMLLAALSILQAVEALVNPTEVSLLIGGITIPHGILISSGMVIGIVLNLVELYFGYAALKLNVSKTMALISLIVGIVLLVGSILLLASGDGINFGLPLACGIMAVSYYVYAKRIIDQNNQDS